MQKLVRFEMLKDLYFSNLSLYDYYFNDYHTVCLSKDPLIGVVSYEMYSTYAYTCKYFDGTIKGKPVIGPSNKQFPIKLCSRDSNRYVDRVDLYFALTHDYACLHNDTGNASYFSDKAERWMCGVRETG